MYNRNITQITVKMQHYLQLRNRERDDSPEQRAEYAQTSKNFGNFWYARRSQRLPHGWLRAGNIVYNPDDRLGHGCEGTVVFRLILPI